MNADPRFPFDPPPVNRNRPRPYRSRPRPCPGCGELMRSGQLVAVWGPLPYRRTARRRDGSYRPAMALGHSSCIETQGGVA